MAMTQHADLEIERNGLMTYDRKLEKCHAWEMRAKSRELIAVPIDDSGMARGDDSRP